MLRTPAINVIAKMCVIPTIEEVSAPGSKASPSEVEILNENDAICFDEKTASLKNELEMSSQKEKDKHVDEKLRRKFVIKTHASSQGKTYIIKGQMEMKDGVKSSSGSTKTMKNDEYDLVKMNDYLNRGLVMFAVDRTVVLDQTMVKDNQINRVHSVGSNQQENESSEAVETKMTKVEKLAPVKLKLDDNLDEMMEGNDDENDGFTLDKDGNFQAPSFN